jgi:hypothetical protein
VFLVGKNAVTHGEVLVLRCVRGWVILRGGSRTVKVPVRTQDASMCGIANHQTPFLILLHLVAQSCFVTSE